MARKKGLKNYTERELIEELARRHADREFRDGMTMSDMELAAEKLKGETGGPSLALMLSRMKPEKPTPKACPNCGKRTPVKARDRERTVRTLSGSITFRRNYHYCERCKRGFVVIRRGQRGGVRLDHLAHLLKLERELKRRRDARIPFEHVDVEQIPRAARTHARADLRPRSDQPLRRERAQRFAQHGAAHAEALHQFRLARQDRFGRVVAAQDGRGQ